MQQLAPLAAEAGLSMATMSLAWVLRNPNVSSAIIGASRPEQVRANVAAVDVQLDDDLLAAIDAIVDPIVERDPAQSAQLVPAAEQLGVRVRGQLCGSRLIGP